ncbi:MAG: hypothetical protein EBT50_00890 [Verrucomicrobia bacterium]|nr:hypothetical protein [Verrucomicrobiota bacterium]
MVELKSAKITFLGQGNALISASGQAVKQGDSLAEKTDMETGSVPVTEVTFEDGSVMRLGEKTKVSYSSKERVVRISQGTVLFHSPEGHGGITLQGAQASGQVAGSTVMGTQDSSGSFSFLLLESSGAGSVTGGTAGTTVIGVGEMTTIRASAAQAPEVVEVHVDAVRDISPLFQQISTPLPSSPQVVGTTEQQAMEIQNDIKLLSSLDDFKLTEMDPEGVALAMICGVGQNEMGASKNILLRPVDTAAGTEAGSEQGSVVAVGGASFPVDARQAEAEALVAATSLPSSGDGLGSTDTAAGGGDLGATDTAAGGGGGGADTQAPASLPAPITSSPNPGLTTPI